jgi:hypothetical protein
MFQRPFLPQKAQSSQKMPEQLLKFIVKKVLGGAILVTCWEKR